MSTEPALVFASLRGYLLEEFMQTPRFHFELVKDLFCVGVVTMSQPGT